MILIDKGGEHIRRQKQSMLAWIWKCLVLQNGGVKCLSKQLA
jgi:hypothetical protein